MWFTKLFTDARKIVWVYLSNLQILNMFVLSHEFDKYSTIKRNCNVCLVVQAFVMSYLSLQVTFSFSSTSDDASVGSTGQAAGLGQGSKLREALLKRKGTNFFNKVKVRNKYSTK